MPTTLTRPSGNPRAYRNARRTTPRHTTRTLLRILRIASWANLLAVATIGAVILVVSERWWLGTVLTYLPRIPFAFPSIILAACALRWRRQLIWLNILAAGLVLGPIARWQWPAYSAASPLRDALRIRIVSCNVQEYLPDLAVVLQEISTFHPNVVALQEGSQDNALLRAYFQDWHVIHEGEFWIASEFPVDRVEVHYSNLFGVATAVNAVLTTPAGPIRLTNLHQTTPRHVLYELNLTTILNGDGPDLIERHARLRGNQANRLRTFSHVDDTTMPQLLAGDFNMPSSSSLYRTNWSGLQNAFDQAGVGFGYTSPCTPHRLWPDYCPWIRVDHILASSHWTIQKCQVGTRNGSDHHLIAATITLANNPTH